jgi:hypothetical protein
VVFLSTHLFSGPEGRATSARIDRRVDQLPGLQGLHLVSRATDRLGTRRPRACV